jgi:hypothetical protein
VYLVLLLLTDGDHVQRARPSFSKRNSSVPDTLCYEVPTATRLRILHKFKQLLESPYVQFDFGHVLDGVAKRILTEYGGYDGDTRRNAFAGTDHPAVIHALACSDERFLDFTEFCLQVWPHQLGQPGVEAVNQFLREDGIGFELTPFRQTFRDRSGKIVQDGGSGTVEYEFPQFMRKDNEYLHQQVVRPCLEALARPGLGTANAEMMKAHQAYRRGEFADAITDAAAAFESVMKSICYQKGWQFNPDSDTCSRLVSSAGKTSSSLRSMRPCSKPRARFATRSAMHMGGDQPIHSQFKKSTRIT